MKEDILLKKIPHNEFKAFAKVELAKKRIYKHVFYTFFIISGFAFFAGLGYGGALFFIDEQIKYPIQIALGLIFCFTILIIVHELLHGLAYKLVGAKKVYFGAVLSQFIFYAGSDQEKFNGTKFRFVALFPFASILVLGLISLLLFPEYFLFTCTVLFMHTLFCSGDFAVMNFMQQYDLKQIYTYDSREKKETYFYQKT